MSNNKRTVLSRTAPSLLGVTLAKEQAEPTILRIAGLRHVAPYWITVCLPIGRKRRRTTAGGAVAAFDAVTETTTITVGDLLEDLSREGNPMLPTAKWWYEELSAERLDLTDDDGDTRSSVRADRVVQQGDVLRGRFHYHERSILDAAPEVVYRDENYVVVTKPPGVDVLSNPGSARVRNSLPGLLVDMFCGGDGCGNDGASPMPAHRLDTAVSGLVCCGRTKSDVKRLSRRMELRESTKLYIARVAVPFDGMPELPLTIEAPLGFDSRQTRAFVDRSGGGKEASTIVTECQGLLDGGKTAVVVVQLLTGRKHQIRCHLQHARMPIANDERYGGTASAGTGMDCRKLLNTYPPSAFGMPNPPQELIDMFQENFVEGCEVCAFARDVLKGQRGCGPSVNCGIWLHSWKYEFPTLGLKFEAPIPWWAQGSGQCD